LSLLQMAKTSAMLARLSEARIPYISVLTDPTTGGVSASLAMLGDVNIGEPKALIGFAGARVIQQTVRETLPEGFQRSEFLLDHGALDMIFDRRDMRDRIAGLLTMLMGKPPVREADSGKSEGVFQRQRGLKGSGRQAFLNYPLSVSRLSLSIDAYARRLARLAANAASPRHRSGVGSGATRARAARVAPSVLSHHHYRRHQR